MIVRLMGEGQWRVDDAVAARLNELDEEVAKAVAAQDEAALWRGLQALADEVREHGERLDDSELLSSDEERAAYDHMIGLAHRVFPYVEGHKFYCEHWYTNLFFNKIREFGALLAEHGFFGPGGKEDLLAAKLRQRTWHTVDVG